MSEQPNDQASAEVVELLMDSTADGVLLSGEQCRLVVDLLTERRGSIWSWISSTITHTMMAGGAKQVTAADAQRATDEIFGPVFGNRSRVTVIRLSDARLLVISAMRRSLRKLKANET